MKKIISIVFAVTVIFMMFFTGCQFSLNPLALDDTGTDGVLEDGISTVPSGEINTGVTFTIPRYAPWIVAAVQPRAFAFVDGVQITIFDSGSAEVTSETFYPEDAAGSENITCSVVIAEGTGYTAQVEIYNDLMSETIPMVSGTSDPFDITEGAVTQVPVLCTPLSPVELTMVNTDYTVTMAATPLDAGGYPIANGGEAWYSITAPSTGYFDISVDLPADYSYYYAVFDSTGAMIVYFTDYIGGPGPGVIHGQGTPGESYYMALIAGAYGATGDFDLTFNWTEVTPNYLSDEDVPDPELRSLMGDYTGKSFSVGGIDPDQADWITDADLSAISDFRTNAVDGHGEYTGITDLTGLEYCTGIGFLLLNENDLSSADFSVLQYLTRLYALDLWGCNLQDLSLVDYLVNPDFHHLKVAYNPALSLEDITSVTAAKFPGMIRLAFSGFDSDSDGSADDVSAGDWETLVDFLATHTALEELSLTGDMNFTDSMFADLAAEVITPKASDWLWLDFGSNSNLTDISSLSGLSSLYDLNLYGTAISDLTPVWDLYNTDGAFTDSDYTNHINITGCNMDITPGSTNETIVNDLIAAGVDVDYEAGNQLIASGPASISGSFDVSYIISEGFGVDSIMVECIDSETSEQSFETFTASDLDMDNKVDYSFSGLDVGKTYWINFICSKTDPDNYYLQAPTQFSDFSGGSDMILDYAMPVPYSADVTVNVNYTGSGTVDASHRIYVNLDNYSYGAIASTEDLSSSTGSVSFTIPTYNEDMYIDIAYDVDGSGWHSAPDPFKFYGTSLSDSDPDSFNITSGPVEIDLEFDDTMRSTEPEQLLIDGTWYMDWDGMGHCLYLYDSSGFEFIFATLDFSYYEIYRLWEWDNDTGFYIVQMIDSSDTGNSGLGKYWPGTWENLIPGESWDSVSYGTADPEVYYSYDTLEEARLVNTADVASTVPVSADPPSADEVRVDVTVNFEYTGTLCSADSRGAVMLTLSDGGPVFAGEGFYYNDFTTDFVGSVTFDDPLYPEGEDVYARIYIDADLSFSFTEGDPYYLCPTPVSVDGGSVDITFDDTSLCASGVADIAGGWETGSVWDELTIAVTEDSIGIYVSDDPADPPTLAEVGSVNNYGDIVAVDNTSGYLIGQWTHHQSDMFMGKYFKLTWGDSDGLYLDSFYYAYDTQAEAIAATSDPVTFSWSSLIY